jgi:hypothetical protein
MDYFDLYTEVAAAGTEDDGVLLVYGRVDDALRRGSLGAVERVLAGEWGDLPVVYSLALLAATMPARRDLRERGGFAGRVRARLTREDPGRVERLLVGLE